MIQWISLQVYFSFGLRVVVLFLVCIITEEPARVEMCLRRLGVLDVIDLFWTDPNVMGILLVSLVLSWECRAFFIAPMTNE